MATIFLNPTALAQVSSYAAKVVNAVPSLTLEAATSRLIGYCLEQYVSFDFEVRPSFAPEAQETTGSIRVDVELTVDQNKTFRSQCLPSRRDLSRMVFAFLSDVDYVLMNIEHAVENLEQTAEYDAQYLQDELGAFVTYTSMNDQEVIEALAMPNEERRVRLENMKHNEHLVLELDDTPNEFGSVLPLAAIQNVLSVVYRTGMSFRIAASLICTTAK